MKNEGYDKTRKILPKYITQSVITDMLDKAKKDRYRNYILLLTLSRTGMRVSEIIKLQKNDIHEDNIIVRQGKGKKDRVIPLEKALGDILGLYIDRMKPKERLFPFSKKWGDRQVRNIVYKYAPKDVDVSPHTFRHSFAVHCLKRGMNIRNLQKILGHGSLTTTQVYLDVTGSDVAENFWKVDW